MPRKTPAKKTSKKPVRKKPVRRKAPPPRQYIPERRPSQIFPEKVSETCCKSKWGCRLISLAVFLFPFIVWPWTLSMHESPKQLFLALIVGIGLITIIIQSFKKGMFDFIPRHLAIPLGLITLIIAFISALKSGLVWQGLLGTDSLSVLGLLLLALWTLFIYHSSRKNCCCLLHVLIVSGSILSLLTILSLAGFNLYKFVPSTGFNPAGTTTAAGILAIITIILTTGSLLRAKRKLLYSLALLPPVVLLLAIGFRIPLVLAAIGLGVFTLLYILQAGLRKNPATTGLLAAAVILFIVLAIYPFTTFLQTPLEVGPSHKETWSIAQQTLKENPLLGSGPGTFAAEYLKYRSLPILQTPFWNIAFNLGSSTGLTALVTLGILGSVLLFITMLSILISFYRDMGNKAALGASALTLFIAIWLVPLPLTTLFFFATILGIMLANLNLRPLQLRLGELGRSFIGIIIIFLIAALFIIQGSRTAADIFAYQGISTADLGKSDTSLSKAARLDPYSDTYLRLLSTTQLAVLQKKLSTAPEDQDPQILLQEIRNLADTALRIARKATKQAPGNATNWVALGNVYLGIAPMTNGAAQAAIDAFTQAQKLSPSDPAILASLALAQLSSGLTSEAKTGLEAAVSLRPDFSNARWFLSQIYEGEGEVKKAIEQIEQIIILNPENPLAKDRLDQLQGLGD